MWRESITYGRVRVSKLVINYILIVSFGNLRKISKCRHKKKIHSRDILNLSLLLLILPLRFSFFSFSMLSEALSAALSALRTPALRDPSGRCPLVWCCCSPASRTALLPILCPSSRGCVTCKVCSAGGPLGRLCPGPVVPARQELRAAFL